MGTQNGPRLQIWPLGILIHTLQLKLRHFEVSPYVCIGKPCICNVFRPRATWGVGLRAHINVTTFTQFILHRLPVCIVWLYCTSSSTMWRFPDNSFFFCLVCGLLEKKFEKLTVQASDNVKDLIMDCSFAGEPCGNLTEVFEPVFTEMGICYTFNSGRKRQHVRSRGIGQRQGLRMMIRINQSDYATPADAGVKVAIHTQCEPPLPADRGIGVPTGRSAFISIKEHDIQNNAGLHCRDNGKTAQFRFLKGEFPSYSESACLVDCVHNAMAGECSCVSVRSFYRPRHFSICPASWLNIGEYLLDALTSPSRGVP